MTTLALSHDFTAQPQAVWALAGDFGGLDHWHPWVPDCRLDADGRTRRIGAGPIEAVEVLQEQTDHSMTYTVTKSPMPVQDYRCTWSIAATGNGCTLSIEATFAPKGVPAETAIAMLSGFFENAFSALEERV